MKQKQKNCLGTEKVTILKRHSVAEEPVSDFCDKYNINPTAF